MYTYRTAIRMRDTDATGVIFFTEQMRLALEAFEQFLCDRGYSLATMIEAQEFLLPIVHAEADYMAPLKVGDKISIDMELGNIGESSFLLRYRFLSREQEVGRVTLVHAAVSKETQKSMSIPENFVLLLRAL